MKQFLRICSCIYIFCYSVFELCYACGNGSLYCTVEEWAPWRSCNATCGRGVRERQKYICCDAFRYRSLKGCLNGCNIPISWWEANATEYKTCGKCQRGGTFIMNKNQCICPHGFGGSCCDLTTASKTLATKILSTTQSSIKLTATGKAKVTTSIQTSAILSTTQSSIKLTAAGKGNCHLACVRRRNQNCYIYITAYVRKVEKKQEVTDDCASGPCQYGTCHDKNDGFHCDCVFFSEGKLCNTLKTWAIPVMALASLAVALTWCCCCWWIIGTGKKDESEKTTKRMNQKIKPKPMERHSEEW